MLVSFVVAMLTTMALIPLLTRVSGRLGMLDRPGPRKVHARVVPRVGGLAMVVGVLIPLLVLHVLPRSILAIVASVIVVVAAGAWDDRRELGVKEKFAAQIVAAAIVVIGGGVQIERLVLWEPLVLPQWVAVPITMIVIVGLTNAVNLADGLDGLAGGTTFLCCCALGVLAYTAGNAPALILALATCGAIVGFLRFNTYPATVFMGDGGSQFLGLTTASLAVLITQQEQAPVAATLPLLLLAVPILDTLLVMGRRIREGRSPFSADKNHLHHRLLALGLSHPASVATIYAVQAGFLVSAYLLRFETDLTIACAFAASGAVLLAALLLAERARARGGSSTWLETLAKRAGRLRAPPIARYSAGALGPLIGIYFVLGAAALDVPQDIGWMAACLLAVCACAASPALSRLRWLAEMGGLYVVAATLAYLVTHGGWTLPIPRAAETAAVALIAVATAAALRCAARERFAPNSMDVLVLFTAIVVPSLPGISWGGLDPASLAARVAVLFYALEVAFRGHAERAAARRAVLFATLGILAARAVV